MFSICRWLKRSRPRTFCLSHSSRGCSSGCRRIWIGVNGGQDGTYGNSLCYDDEQAGTYPGWSSADPQCGCPETEEGGREENSERARCEVPYAGSGGGCGRTDCGNRGQCSDGNATFDVSEPWFGKGEPRSNHAEEEECQSNQRAVGIRERTGSGSGSWSRRIWRPKTLWWFWFFARGCDALGGDCFGFDSGQGSKIQRVEDRDGTGPCFILGFERDWLARIWEEDGSCEESAEAVVVGCSRRYLQHHRKGYGRRPHQPNHNTRATTADTVCKGVGGTSVEDRSLEDFSVLSMGGSRCSRFLGQRKRGGLQSTSMPASFDAGSMCLRQRQLDIGCGVISGIESSNECVEPTCAPSNSRWRITVQQTARCPLGGGCTIAPARDGGIHEARQVGKERNSNCRPHRSTTEQGQSQGKGCGGEGERANVNQKAACQSSELEQPTVHVPGLNAPTIYVPALVNSMVRLLLKCGGSLASFVSSCLSCDPGCLDDRTLNNSIWPMLLPYYEAFGRDAVNSLRNWRKRRLCLQVMTLNWLFLGRPNVAPKMLISSRRLSSRQWRTVRLLEWLSEDENSVEKVDAASMGRTAAKAESQVEELAALHRACDSLHCNWGGYFSRSWQRHGHDGIANDDAVERVLDAVTGTLDFPPNVVAKPIQADRIKFGDPPKFDPTKYVDSRTAAAFSCPQSFRKEPEVKIPVVSVRATMNERTKLFQKMARCGRLQFLHAEEVDVAHPSGLFAVPKSLDKDRLILDGRPANAIEHQMNRWVSCMACAANLGGIELEPDEDLKMSGQDIKDFFYQFSVTRDRTRRNVLACKLTPSELLEIFGPDFSPPEDGGFVGLSTLAMGDGSACEYAQASHLGLLFSANALFPEELMRLRGPPPRSLLSIGIVIDDLVLLERVSRGLCYISTQAESRMHLIKEAYCKAGLPINPDKEFLGADTASFWGVETDGRKGLFRPNSQRVWPLVLITVRVCSLGLSTVALLESLCGSWISVLMTRRRLLSLMVEIFSLVSSGLEQKTIVRLSPEVKDELMSMVQLVSLACVNLRAQTQPFLKATDSSDWGSAAVVCQVPVGIAREAFRHSLSRSLWSRLLPAGKAWMKCKDMLDPQEELPDEKSYSTHPLWEVLARALPYKEEWRRRHLKQVHINVSELAAHLREEARVATNLTSARILYALDSQVSLAALVKGRSASRSLNSLLQRSLPHMLGSDLYAGLGFFASSINRADGPTRSTPPPPPDMSLPHWWSDLADGKCDGFDAWLDEAHRRAVLDPVNVDFSELGYHEPVTLVTGRKQRKQKFFGAVDRPSAHSAVSTTETVAKPVVTLTEEVICMLETIPGVQIWWKDEKCRNFRQAGALDLYTGRGGVAKGLLHFDCPFVVTYEWKRSAEENLLIRNLQLFILGLVKARAFRVVGAAIICVSFSRAVTPAVRSSRFPRGLPSMRRSMKQRVKEGNVHSDFVSELVVAAEEVDALYWVENPDGSFLWHQRGYKRYKSPASRLVFRADYCRFGTSWRKRTRVATNSSSLGGLRMLCTCTQPHTVLRGMHPIRKIPWTAVAEPYPAGFSKLLASALATDAGWASKKLNIAACCRSRSLRIGEAENPGPRKSNAPRNFSLEFCPVQRPETVALGDKHWSLFLDWSKREIRSINCLALFLEVPIFLAHALRRYGDIQFSAGSSILYYRHLILAAQRKVPTLKPYAQVCWDLASRWEACEPVTHRVPIPLPIMQAMALCAINLGWARWAGILVLCFYGMARVGEVLQCVRGDLLLPSYLLTEYKGCAYLHLRKSKTSSRGNFKKQHLRIDDPVAVKLLEKIYCDAVPDVLLFAGSPSIFRARWNYLLKLLRIPSLCRLTPGGLRGGGAVESYRRGVHLGSIQWLMRLKSSQTLESYIQELAAVSALTNLPADVLYSVRCCSKLFDFAALGISRQRPWGLGEAACFASLFAPKSLCPKMVATYVVDLCCGIFTNLFLLQTMPYAGPSCRRYPGNSVFDGLFNAHQTLAVDNCVYIDGSWDEKGAALCYASTDLSQHEPNVYDGMSAAFTAQPTHPGQACSGGGYLCRWPLLWNFHKPIFAADHALRWTILQKISWQFCIWRFV